MRVSNLVGGFILWLCMPYGFADTPPPPMHAEPGPDGTPIPYFNQYAYAYIGKVVGYSENEWKDPALEVQVLGCLDADAKERRRPDGRCAWRLRSPQVSDRHSLASNLLLPRNCSLGRSPGACRSWCRTLTIRSSGPL